MRKVLLGMVAAAGLTAFAAVPAKACTSYYVGSELTKDGSTLFGRTEDVGDYHDKVFDVIDSKDVPENGMWVDEDGGTEFTAPYKEGLTKTYRYTACRDGEKGYGLFGEVGVNEKGVSMSATTTAGNSEAAQAADPFVGKTGISEENYVDYVLCQADSARDGVEILADAIDEYGVWYTADGVFIADKNEVWYMEILSGSQYCAVKMPEDKAALIPNCLVLGDIDVTDENVIASEGIISKAKEGNIYHASLTDPDNENALNIKLTYGGNGYSAGNADRIRAGQYILTGKDNTAIYKDNYQDIFFDVPSKDVTVEKLYQLAGSQYEEYADGAFEAGRVDANGEEIEDSIRVIGTNRSQECHILQIRSDMPAELATVEWLSMSSAAYSPMVPYYGALLTDVAEPYKKAEVEQGENPVSAYGIFKQLDSYCRQNMNTIGEKVKTFYKGYVHKLEEDQKNVDKELMDIYNNTPAQLSQKATELGISIGDQTIEMAKKLNAEAMADDVFQISTSYEDIHYSLTAKPEKEEAEQPAEEEKKAQPVAAPAKVTIKKLKNRKGKKLQVRFKKVADAAGYEIAYSRGVNFGKKKTKVKSFNAAKNVRTLKKLKKGKRYFVKVRAYKMDGTQKVYGKWSQVRVVKIKK